MEDAFGNVLLLLLPPAEYLEDGCDKEASAVATAAAAAASEAAEAEAGGNEVICSQYSTHNGC